MHCRPQFINALWIFVLLYFGLVISVSALPISYESGSAKDSTSQRFGVIQFNIETDTAYLYLNHDYDSVITITADKELTLPAGPHWLEIFGKNLSDARLFLNLKEDETNIVHIHMARSGRQRLDNPMYAFYMWNANIMLFSDEDTFISLPNTGHESYGMLKADLSPGLHRVHFTGANGRESTRFLEVNKHKLITAETYFKPQRSVAIATGVIPGASQLYKRETGRAALIFSLVGVSTGLAFQYDQMLRNESRTFNSVLVTYQNTSSEQEALVLGNQLDRLSRTMHTYQRNRNIFRNTAILFYLANIVDAFREPDMGFARKRPFNPYRDFSVDMQDEAVVATVTIRF